MNCPHCHEPIDPALVRKAANSDAGSRARPGARGQAKTGCAHRHMSPLDAISGLGICPDCDRHVRWNGTKGKWRILYPKQKSPSK